MHIERFMSACLDEAPHNRMCIPVASVNGRCENSIHFKSIRVLPAPCNRDHFSLGKSRENPISAGISFCLMIIGPESLCKRKLRCAEFPDNYTGCMTCTTKIGRCSWKRKYRDLLCGSFYPVALRGNMDQKSCSPSFGSGLCNSHSRYREDLTAYE